MATRPGQRASLTLDRSVNPPTHHVSPRPSSPETRELTASHLAYCRVHFCHGMSKFGVGVPMAPRHFCDRLQSIFKIGRREVWSLPAVLSKLGRPRRPRPQRWMAKQMAMKMPAGRQSCCFLALKPSCRFAFLCKHHKRYSAHFIHIELILWSWPIIGVPTTKPPCSSLSTS